MFYIGSRLGIKKEFEIRTRYEYGENLKELAIRYRVPEITLKKRKKKSELKGDPWIKGFRKEKGFKEFIKSNEEAKEELLKEIEQEAREELATLNDFLEKSYKKSNRRLDEFLEGIYTVRSARIKDNLRLRKEIERIYTPEELLRIESLKVQIENKRLEAKIKAEELKLKKLETTREIEMAKHYGIVVSDE